MYSRCSDRCCARQWLHDQPTKGESFATRYDRPEGRLQSQVRNQASVAQGICRQHWSEQLFASPTLTFSQINFRRPFERLRKSTAPFLSRTSWSSTSRTCL